MGHRRRAEMLADIFDCELEVHWAEEAADQRPAGA